MRHPRIRPQDTDTFMHVYNRIAGTAGDFPFGDAEKEQFVRRLKRISELYVIEPLAFQIMGNHFHLLVHIPCAVPSLAEAAERYRRYHQGKKTLSVDNPDCQALALKLRDISEFMKDLEQPFTRWFNRTRSVRRRGHLWAERFKNTLLENGLAVWDCWKYIEMNPVRAGLVVDPGDYRFCSFGQWKGAGRHPFEDAVTKRLMGRFRELLHVKTLEELQRELHKEFARIRATERKASPDQIEAAVEKAAEKEVFTRRVDRRVRYWVDGLVIGSELFVKTTMGTARGEAAVAKRRLVRAVSGLEGKTLEPIYSFKQLRVLAQ